MIDEAERKENCLYYSEPGNCNTCESDYYVQNNGCTQTTASNCLISKNSTACETCPDNYGFHEHSNKLDCKEFTDKNCIISGNIYPFQCF